MNDQAPLPDFEPTSQPADPTPTRKPRRKPQRRAAKVVRRGQPPNPKKAAFPVARTRHFGVDKAAGTSIELTAEHIKVIKYLQGQPPAIAKLIMSIASGLIA